MKTACSGIIKPTRQIATTVPLKRNSSRASAYPAVVDTTKTPRVMPSATIIELKNHRGVCPNANNAKKFSNVKGMGINPNPVDDVVLAKTSLG